MALYSCDPMPRLWQWLVKQVHKLINTKNEYTAMTWKDNWQDTEALRSYAKENMKEGYLSEDEEEFLDAVFDELQSYRNMQAQINRLLRESGTNSVI